MLAGGQAGTALGTVMRVWLERQIELRGFYNINLTSTALALALASRHPALAEVQARPFPGLYVLPWRQRQEESRCATFWL